MREPHDPVERMEDLKYRMGLKLQQKGKMRQIKKTTPFKKVRDGKAKEIMLNYGATLESISVKTTDRNYLE